MNNCSFIDRFKGLYDRRIEYYDLEYNLREGRKSPLVPLVDGGKLLHSEAFREMRLTYLEECLVVDKKYADCFNIDNCTIVDSSKFDSAEYRTAVLSELPVQFCFIELKTTNADIEWVLYNRQAYDIGMSNSFSKSCFDYFLYLKPNVFVSDGNFLLPPISKSQLRCSEDVFRFAYAQNILKNENRDKYYKYMGNYIKYHNSIGHISIFENKIIPRNYSINELSKYFEKLFNENWSGKETVFSFKGTIFLEGVTFGRDIKWEMGTGQFSYPASSTNENVMSNPDMCIANDCKCVLECFMGAKFSLNARSRVKDLDEVIAKDADIRWLVDQYRGRYWRLADLPSDFNSCVHFSEYNDRGLKEHDFCCRNLRNFIVPSEYFLEEAYKSNSQEGNTPFKNSILYGIDFNGFPCKQSTFYGSKLKECFTVKGKTVFEDNINYSQIFKNCDYKELISNDYENIFKIIEINSKVSQDCVKDLSDSEIVNEIKGIIKNGCTLGEAKQILLNKGINCNNVVNKLYSSLLNSCQRNIDTLLNPNKNGGSSRLTVGAVKDKLILEGYPRDIVCEAISEYIRDEYLVD